MSTTAYVTRFLLLSIIIISSYFRVNLVAVLNTMSSCLYSWPPISVSSTSVSTEGRLYHATLYEGLEHLWILISKEILEIISPALLPKTTVICFNEVTLVLRNQKMRIFPLLTKQGRR